MASRIFFSILSIVFIAVQANAQISLKGPVCVLADFEYNYYVSYEGDYTGQVSVCLVGGYFSDSRDTCKTTSLNSLFKINWRSNAGGALVIITANGKSEKTVIGSTRALYGGDIISANKRQQLKYDTTSGVIFCTVPVGGSCSPEYEFQWQSSTDAIAWADISGANEPNLKPTGRLKQPVFYRRRVKEARSGEIAYSTIATVFVDAELRSK